VAEQISIAEWLCVNEFDVSGVSSNFGLERTADLEEFTCFAPPSDTAPTAIFKKRLAGVESCKVSNAGYLDMGINLPAAKAALGTSPIISKGDNRTLGSGVYMFVGKESSFSDGGEVGKVIPFSMELLSDGIVTYGSLFEFGSKTATGNGTSRTMPAVIAGKSLYLHAHVISVSGTSTPTLTLIYETSAIGDYSDAITKHTFTDFTAAGVQRAIKTPAISDLNHRFRWVISGTNPIFVVRLVAGVR